MITILFTQRVLKHHIHCIRIMPPFTPFLSVWTKSKMLPPNFFGYPYDHTSVVSHPQMHWRWECRGNEWGRLLPRFWAKVTVHQIKGIHQCRLTTHKQCGGGGGGRGGGARTNNAVSLGPGVYIALFDVPNSNRFNILSIFIFRNLLSSKKKLL